MTKPGSGPNGVIDMLREARRLERAEDKPAEIAPPLKTMASTILSVRIDTLSFLATIDKIKSFLLEDRLHTIATINPEFIITAQKDEEFRYILNHTDLNVLDGTGVQLAVEMIHRRICERVTGVDLTWALAQIAAERGYSIFFLGAAEGIALGAANRLKHQYPGLRIAGCYAGRPDEEGLVSRINLTHPDILLVAFGAPKQEKFIRLDQPVHAQDQCQGNKSRVCNSR